MSDYLVKNLNDKKIIPISCGLCEMDCTNCESQKLIKEHNKNIEKYKVFNKIVKQIDNECIDDDSEIDLCIGRTYSVNLEGNFTEEDLEIILKALREAKKLEYT